MSKTNITILDRIKFIDDLFLLNVKYVSLFSESLFNSLDIGWANYTDKKNSNKKRDRNLDKILKIIEKLKVIELKKKDMYELDYILKSISFIEANLFMNLERKYYKKILCVVKDSNSLSELLLLLCNEYSNLLDNYDKNVDEFKKESNIVLPVTKEAKKVASDRLERQSKKINKISYIKDKHDDIVYHIKYENDVMILDMNSFNYEKNKYKEALNVLAENFDFREDMRLAPCEKKRRIFIQSMFQLEKNLNLFSKKEITITYPIEKYFMFSKEIVDNLYRELIDFHQKENVFDYLLIKTKEVYGCERLIDKYDLIVMEFEKNIKELDKYICEELYLSSLKARKSSEYIEFKNSKGMVPSVTEIYVIINNRVMKGLNSYINEYLKNIKYNVGRVTKYMTINEVVLFYEEIKTIIMRNYVQYSNKITYYMVELQDTLSGILSERLNISKEKVIIEYFKEEIII